MPSTPKGPYSALTLFWILFLLPSVAWAWGFHLEVTGFPSYSESNTGALGSGSFGGTFDGTDLKSESGFSYDVRAAAGIKPVDWLMLGVTYDIASAPSHRDGSSSDPSLSPAPSLDHTFQTSEWGPSLGFFYQNFRLIGTYFLSGNIKSSDRAVQADGTVASDQTLEAKLDSGFEIIVGYSFAVTPVFRIGPSLAYRKVSYKTQTLVNNVDPSQSYTDQAFTTKAEKAGLLPMISLMLDF